ncbi:hypothetical protein F2Q68_00034531 [Brassica cretica]|uniref:Uncharacterized protein n=2 Tax=Brassica cretica TaxID=69181 RepID=A0A3N6S6Z7_BRACR|nr:hypothetical protein F2Q68_00034531 [Brassica cretica]KAF3488036.1 hypothetical protein F2Q69_00053318 [Brassica cretica]KAF3592490.1 hypothetical protein DY000_02022361 [Brassica cretica]
MAIQVLGKLHGFSVGVHEILYSYYFAPLINKAGFYHLRSRDGSPLVEEPSRGVRGNYPYGDGWNSRYVFLKFQEPVGYPTSWRTIDVSRPVSFAGEALAKLLMGVPRRFRLVTFLVNREALRHSRVWGNVSRSPVSVVYDEYQKTKTRKRRPSYTPPPRLARATLSANGLSSTSSKSAEVVPNRDLLVDAHRRLIGEVFLLCSQMKDMVARRDLLIQQVKASARWELMKEWLEKRVEHWNPLLVAPFGFMNNDASYSYPLLVASHASDSSVLHILRGCLSAYSPVEIRRLHWDPGIYIWTLRSHGNPEVLSDAVWEPGGLDSKIFDWNPEVLEVEPEGSSSDPETFGRNPEAIGEPGGTVFRLPRQGYYRYLFGFRILPLGSWSLSSSYDVFYFCRKSLTGFRGCWCGCCDPRARLHCFPRLEKQDFDCSMYFTVLLQ